MNTIKYADYTRNTQERVKRIAHSRRHPQALRIANPQANDIILDYGCGDGHFLSLITNVPRDRIVAYDPDLNLLGQMDQELAASVQVFSDRDRLLTEHKRGFSLILCMEVCEHLPAAALHTCLESIRDLCADNARVIFGVPIETGSSGFAKGLYRLMKGARMGATVGSSFRALFSLPIERQLTHENWHGSHIGFDDRKFKAQLKEYGFKIQKEIYLPFLPLRRVINNEVYYVCTL